MWHHMPSITRMEAGRREGERRGKGWGKRGRREGPSCLPVAAAITITITITIVVLRAWSAALSPWQIAEGVEGVGEG